MDREIAIENTWKRGVGVNGCQLTDLPGENVCMRGERRRSPLSQCWLQCNRKFMVNLQIWQRSVCVRVCVCVYKCVYVEEEE